MRQFKVVLAIVVLLGQFYFGALPARAAHPSQPLAKNGHPENYKGAILSATPTAIELLLKDGSRIEIAVSAETRIKIPAHKNVSIFDLKTGMDAVVQARRHSDGSLIASQIHAKAPHFSMRHILGTVSAYLPGQSITITDSQGNTRTFRVSNDTTFLPEEAAPILTAGALVTIVASDEDEETALGIAIHPPAP